MPELFVNYVQNGAGEGREAGDMSGQLKCASCEPRNYKYFRSANYAPRQSFANGFRHVRLRSSSCQYSSTVECMAGSSMLCCDIRLTTSKRHRW
jgi:hypothetical protein